MFKTICSEITQDPDYPKRAHEVDISYRVLDGTIYDHLQYGFHEEKSPADEYIPIRKRRPCIKSNLCKVVVDDSVSLLFSEGHFPELECGKKGEEIRQSLHSVMKDIKLNEVMIDAAIRGSVGSIAILFKVLNNRIFLEVKNTQFLTPCWDPNEPDTLQCVTEQYKCKGSAFIAAGYKGIDKDEVYWFRRDWDKTKETHYKPLKNTDYTEGKPFVEDTAKSVSHGLGFTPVIWIKNLPGKTDNDIDGACTFTAAIDTQIEIDYQLSQAGRGLKYSSDPTLMIKEPGYGDTGTTQTTKTGGAANALIVSENGDAKLLEISGSAAAAVIEYVKALRELGLESIHGNRVNADKISAAQSGRAMEMMNQALIWLADKLRTPYGEGALVDIIYMIIKASNKFTLTTKRGDRIPKIPTGTQISLRWPAWYAPTSTDLTSTANALATMIEAGIMSQETAIKTIASIYDVEDVVAEKALIDAAIEVKHKKEVELKAKAPKETPKKSPDKGLN